MKVIDIITYSLRLIGRPQLIPHIRDTSNAGDEDSDDVIETLLYCFNAVEDELARKYVPLVACEEMVSDDNRFYYSEFKHSPLKIKKVTVDGKSVAYKLLAKFMEVEANRVKVEYEYAPTRKRVDDNSDFGEEVGEYIISLGIAAEYSVINGEAEMADRWEQKYREKLDLLRRTLPVCASIPPRRWV